MPLARNVLIFHQAALGDFVLNWPLALAAGRLFPQSRIFYVTAGQKGQLARQVLKIESIDIEPGWHALHGEASRLPESARKRLAGAHCIFSFVNRPGDAWEENVRRLAPEAQIHCLNPTPPADDARHASQFLLDQLAGQPAIHAAVEQILQSITARGIAPLPVGDALNRPILLHPGAGSPGKCWPIEQFADLAGRLADRGAEVQVLLGEVERGRLSEADLRRFPQSVRRRFLETPLELLDALQAGRCLIGNDSGPAHLAGILGYPVVALFGPTDPAVWRPLGPNVRVLRGQPLNKLKVEAVLQWVGQYAVGSRQ